MDKTLNERFAALKAKASNDPKGIDSIVDAVGDEDAFIQKVVEKIMSKMDAQDGAGKYKVDAKGTNKKEAAYSRVLSLVKKAFDMPGAAPAMGAPAAGGMSPMDPLFGETPSGEAAEASVPELAPVQKLEEEAKSFGDPALDALVNVIELLIKKDMGGALPDAAAPAGPAAPMADDMGAGSPPPADASGEDAPLFGGAPVEEAETESEDPSPFGGEEKPAEKKEKSGDKKSDDKKSGDEKPEEKIEARLRALVSLPAPERIARAAQLRQLAEVAESGELPAFMKDDAEKDEDKEDKMDKEAMKTVLRAALAALEMEEKGKGESEKTDEMPADPEERTKEQEKLASLDRKAKVLQHLASLKLQKEATVDGKSMATPAGVPKAEGTVEDNLSGDAKVQYQNALGEVNLGEIQTKKQKLPSDESHGDEAVMYAGNTPGEHMVIQTESDSSKGVNNKRVQQDMATNSIPAEPHSPTEMSSDKGSHQKEKAWDKAVAESDTTPSGPRLVGLASSTDLVGRAVKLARLAQEKGVVASEDQFDELVTRYASFSNEKFAMQVEVIEEMPTVNASMRKQSEDAIWADNEAVMDDEEHPEKVNKDKMPEKKEAALLATAKETAKVHGLKPTAGVARYLTTVSDGGSVVGVRPPMPMVRNERFAALADPDLFNWKGVTTAWLEAERNGTLDQKGQRNSAEL